MEFGAHGQYVSTVTSSPASTDNATWTHHKVWSKPSLVVCVEWFSSVRGLARARWEKRKGTSAACFPPICFDRNFPTKKNWKKNSPTQQEAPTNNTTGPNQQHNNPNLRKKLYQKPERESTVRYFLFLQFCARKPPVEAAAERGCTTYL